MNKKRIVILISGRGSNMQSIVKNVKNGILQECCDVISVFSNNSEAAGLEIAAGMGLSTHCIASKGKKRSTYNSLLLEWLQQLNPDFIVLAGYMRVLPHEIISAFPHRIINIHPADTNDHQGLHGYEWAFENNLDTTKITVHYVDEGLDTGTVIEQAEVDLRGAETLEEVERRGLTVEHQFYSEVLKKIFTSENI